MMSGRRVRGILGVALTWGITFAAIAGAFLLGGLATGLVSASVFTPGVVIEAVVRNFVAWTAIGGIFAWLLSAAEGDRTLRTLARRRVAMWGAFAAAPIPFIAVAFSGVVLPAGVLVAGGVAFAAIGGALATSTVSIARRAELRRLTDVPRLPA